MDIEAITTLLDDLTEMAVTILEKDHVELKDMKAQLDEYVGAVTSKLQGPAKTLADKEFTKCRTVARDWIAVYSDTDFSTDVKADILKEEAIEFFFTMDERIISVQKNFFLLGMIDEILEPSVSLSESVRTAKTMNAKIQVLAREKGLTSAKQFQESNTSDPVRLWFFGDEQNLLQSNEEGLNDNEAVDYLLGLSN